MVYIKWQCDICKDVVISNTKKRHEIDYCKCKKSAMDVEEEYIRCLGKPITLLKYDYDFYQELLLCIEEQGNKEIFLPQAEFDIIGIPYHYRDNTFIRQLEDEMKEQLK